MLVILVEGKGPKIRSNKSDIVFKLLRAYFGKSLEKHKLELILEKYNKGMLKSSKKYKVDKLILIVNPLEYAEDGATFEIIFEGKMNLKKLLEEAFILQGFRDNIKDHYKMDKIKKLIFTTEVRLHIDSFDETKIKKSSLRDIKEVAMTYYDI
ncbi:hypothetical protein KO317_01470 [Candidatus Micrarchaeota archaeon]|jgi:hypothetical protein|nr:hypothetical protein [Candidatus Micrarchaeota archaeon]